MFLPSISRSRPSQWRPHVSRRSFRPRLEALEDRTTPSTFKVLNLNDSGAGSLRQAIMDANAHPGADVIQFASPQGTIALTSGEIDVTGDLTTRGFDLLTIDGGGLSRIFGIFGASVAFQDLTLTNGLADSGGAILNQGGKLTLTNVTFTNNQAVSSEAIGGAILSTGAGATLNVKNCTFSANQANGSNISAGGAIYADAGTTLIVSGSTFVQNTAGGVVDDQRSAGGAIANGFLNGGGMATVTNCIFTFNMVGGNASSFIACGGAIYNDAGGSLSVSSSEFNLNMAEGSNQTYGGAIENSMAGRAGASLSVSDSRFTINIAMVAPNNPLAIAVHGGAIGSINSTVVISGCRFEFNRASAPDGASFLPRVPGADAPDNHCQAGGGAIYVQLGAMTIGNSVFRENQAVGGRGGFAYYLSAGRGGKGSAADGGAVESLGGDLSLDSDTFIKNITGGGEGGFGGQQGGDGGQGGTATGGAITIERAALSIHNSLFKENEAVDSNGGIGFGGGAGGAAGTNTGGALALIDVDLDLENTQFIMNIAGGGFGGCGFFGGPAGPGGAGRGGAIGSPNAAGGIGTIANCLFQDNIAGGGSTGEADNFDLLARGGDGLGGALWNSGSNILAIVDCAFGGNQALGGGGVPNGCGIGGAIYNAGDPITLRGVTFFNNHASTSNDDVFGPVIIASAHNQVSGGIGQIGALGDGGAGWNARAPITLNSVRSAINDTNKANVDVFWVFALTLPME